MSILSFSLEGKVAIVTGGGTGIGKSIALEFAKAGADVVVSSRRLAVLEAVAKEIRALGRRCLTVPADVSQKTDMDNLAQRVVDEFGVIDILVNNAGTFGTTPLDVGFLNTTEDEWDRVIDIDLKGCYLCSQATGKRMVERRKGNIINISSISGMSTCLWESSTYNVAKAGVIMLTRCLAGELSPYNIRVNCIAPGGVKTELTQPLWSDPEFTKRFKTTRPRLRFAETSEIASIALFLASDASSYITGETIVADGGSLI